MDDTTSNQAAVFGKCLEIFESRTSAYGEVWKQYGALSNLLSAARKIDRLMEMWWRGDGSVPAIHKDALDDAIDAMNYLAFFVRNATEGNLTGSVPVRPEHPTESAPCLRLVDEAYSGQTDSHKCPQCHRSLIGRPRACVEHGQPHETIDARNDWTPGSF